MNLSFETSEVARTLRHLESTLQRLVETLAHATPVIDIEDSSSRYAPIRRICEAYSTIDYGMEDEVSESSSCLAAIGANTDMLEAADAVNRAKAEFKAICTPLTRLQVRIPTKDPAAPTRAISALRFILRTIQRSDLNLLAAYRKLPILLAPPASITYTRACTRAVYRKTVEQIFTLLTSVQGPSGVADRLKLDSLDPRETHLAFAKDHYPNTRANIVYSRLDRRGRGRVQVSAELPLLYSLGARSTPPMVRFPNRGDSLTPRHERPSRLEAIPFLESLPVYRYADRPHLLQINRRPESAPYSPALPL